MIIIRKIITTLLCIILTLLIIIEISYTSIAKAISKQDIKESIKTNFLTGLMYDNNGNKTEIFNTILELTTLDEETVKKLMENETADEIITDIVNSIYDYNLTHDEKVKYTQNQITSTVENNIDKVLSEINYSITPKERQEILDYTKNNTQKILDKIYTTDIGDYTK